MSLTAQSAIEVPSSEPKCTCENKEVRRAFSDLLGKYLVRQCLKCGKNWERVSTRRFPTNVLGVIKDFDHQLRERWHELRAAYWKARSESKNAKWWQEYTEYLDSETWREKRAAALKRDRYVCQVCKRRQAKHVHHLTYENMGNEPLEDLQSVCLECHQELHPHREIA